MSLVRARVVCLLAALTLGTAVPGAALAQAPTGPLPGLEDTPPPFEGGDDQEPADGGDPADGGEPTGGGEPAGGGEPTGGGEGRDGHEHADELAELPNTGSEPLLLGLTGAALALVGTGLRLRTLDADLF